MASAEFDDFGKRFSGKVSLFVFEEPPLRFLTELAERLDPKAQISSAPAALEKIIKARDAFGIERRII